jgi:hypothetical protein
MLDLYRAEGRKILGQRWIVWLLIWVWPVGGILVPLLVLVGSWLTPAGADNGLRVIFRWTDTAVGTWILPTNLFGRLLFISLAVSIFASEYQWGTWKTIIPRADRIQLVLAKYLAFTSLLVLGFALMSVLLTLGLGIIQAARGLPYPPDVTPEVLQTFARDYFVQVTLTVINTLIGVAFGAILAIVTRSTIGGVLGGILFIAGEIGFIAGVTTLAFLFKSPEIAGLARFTSSINIANIASLVRTNQPLPVLYEGTPTNTLTSSFVILGLWLTGLVALNLWLFQRQDIS